MNPMLPLTPFGWCQVFQVDGLIFNAELGCPFAKFAEEYSQTGVAVFKDCVVNAMEIKRVVLLAGTVAVPNNIVQFSPSGSESVQ